MSRHRSRAGGSSDPAAGLDAAARQTFADLFGLALTGLARIWERVAEEASSLRTQPLPMFALGPQTLWATLQVPEKLRRRRFYAQGERIAIAAVLAEATGGALSYFSLLRPYSEARIAELFARETRYDHVFSSCNRNFRLSGHDGPLWCGECPKCHFVFLILAPVMRKDRLVSIFKRNLLAEPRYEASFRELTGLAGQKPWECVGEILEAAACLHLLTGRPEWAGDAIVAALRDDLIAQYGEPALEKAMRDLMTDSAEHHVPAELAARIGSHAL
jgi:hypothetical protein